MKLSKQAVLEFIEVYKGESDKELSYEEAETLGLEILHYCLLVSSRNCQKTITEVRDNNSLI